MYERKVALRSSTRIKLKEFLELCENDIPIKFTTKTFTSSTSWRIKKTKNLKSTRLFSPKKVALPFRVKRDQTVSNEKFVRNQIRISDLSTNFRDSSENRTFHVTVNASKSFEL